MSTPDGLDPIERFGACLAGVQITLDWVSLGQAHCEGDGSDFFAPGDQLALGDAALHFASDLPDAWSNPSTPGRSLYLGVSLFELWPGLFEHLVLGRVQRWISLDGPVTRELNRTLGVVENELSIELPRIEAQGLEAPLDPPVDHGWMVSVINDPEAFPALHDELYARGPKGAARVPPTGRGDLDADRVRALELTTHLLGSLTDDAYLTTTDEERPVVEQAARTLGRRLVFEPRARLSPIVGDPVRRARFVP